MSAYDFDYRSRAPTDRLAPLVESIWYARGTVPYASERIAPTGSTVAVLVLGPPLEMRADNGEGPLVRVERGAVIGPHDRPVSNAPQGETFAVGIVTTPVGCEATFGFPPASLRGAVAPVQTGWPAGAALRQALASLGPSPDPDTLVDRVHAALLEGLGPTPSGFARARQAVALLEADPTRAIADIAAELGVSHGHLHRQVTRVVGLPPRALARLLRMRRLLARIDPWSDAPWADLAAELGWFDQAHLIRDFKRHTGVTPTAYLKAQRAAYPKDEGIDGAGFVPDPEPRGS